MTTFRRQLKNVVYNYSEAEVKVREATSNDVWGPSAAVMRDIAEYTFHVEAYTHVMGMIWKRLNDHGKNWRHVYKSLVVLDYLVKNGSDRVAQQCRDNIFSIQTLKDFQFIDKDGKDQGVNVREKAKELAALVKDKDRVKEERLRARRSRDHLGDNPLTGIGSHHEDVDGSPPVSSPTSSTGGASTSQNINQARPSDPTEEDIQLQLALQMSKEHQEEQDRLRKQEEETLKMAIELSKSEASTGADDSSHGNNAFGDSSTGGVLADFSDPWGDNTTEEAPPLYAVVDKSKKLNNDPWATPAVTNNEPTQEPALLFSSDPPPSDFVTPTVDPWGSSATADQPMTKSDDPWGSSAPVTMTTIAAPDDFTFPLDNTGDDIGTVIPSVMNQGNPFNLSDLSSTLPPSLMPENTSYEEKRIEDKFLGENGSLVDLDALLAQPLPFPTTSNPFGNPGNPTVTMGTSPKPANPFGSNKQARPTLNELIHKPSGLQQQQVSAGGDFLPPPLIPDPTSQQPPLNPFS